MNLNLTLNTSEEMRAASAFITLLADIREGSTKDGAVLGAIIQKELAHVEQEPPVAMEPSVEEAAPVEEAPEAPVKEAVKRSKKVVASKPAESASDTPQSSAPPDLSLDDVRAALQRYTAVHGMQNGISILKSYGAGRISELDANQYALFIAECDAPAEAA